MNHFCYYNYCCSIRMALVLHSPTKVDMPLNKKVNQAFIIILSLVILHHNKPPLGMDHFCYYHYCCSIRMALVLHSPIKVDMPLNKKVNQAFIIILSLVILHHNKTPLGMDHFGYYHYCCSIKMALV